MDQINQLLLRRNISSDKRSAVRDQFARSSYSLECLENTEDSRLSGHEECVNAINFSPSGDLVVSGSDDETIKIWDFNTQNIDATPMVAPTRTPANLVELLALEFCEEILDRHYNLSSSNGSSDDSMDDDSQEDDEEDEDQDSSDFDSYCDEDEEDEEEDEDDGPKPEIPISYRQKYDGHISSMTIKSCSFYGPNDEYVMSGSDDKNIYIWEKKTGNLVRVLEGHDDIVNNAIGHPLRPSIISAGLDSEIYIWEPEGKYPSPKELAKRQKKLLSYQDPDSKSMRERSLDDATDAFASSCSQQ
eukprot:gene429-511_t